MDSFSPYNSIHQDYGFRSPRDTYPLYSGRGHHSPRYTSDGVYATASCIRQSSRKHSFSSGSRAKQRQHRNSIFYYRASDSYEEADEVEYVEINGALYMIPARSRSKRSMDNHHSTNTAGGARGTDHHRYAQDSHWPEHLEREPYEIPRYHEEPRRPARCSPRGSTPIPQRPQTARPASSHAKKPPAPLKATEADAKKHRIPRGYSLRNWDPTEEPIMLLGSVFDANSLGKWIYDWTVYRHGPSTPISDMAGEMWLLLIQLAGKVKRAEDSMPKIRAPENKEMVRDFIESGERLTDKLRKLLKACEAPMLKSSKKKDSELGKNAGIEFVETMFGRDRELEKTERFMQSVRLWNLRFDANCEDILKRPTQ